MKRVSCYIIFLLGMLLLSSCSPSKVNNSLMDEEENSSSLGPVRSEFSFAQIGGQIAYFTYQSVHFMVGKGKQEKIVKLPSNREWQEIIAGEDYFYIYCSAEQERKYLEKDGILYGYYDEDSDFYSWVGNNSNSHIEATHYIEEDEFLDKFPNKMTDWNKIEGGEEVKVANLQLYRCSTDYFHKTEYYSDRKPLPVLGQVDYILYCDGRLSSEEYDTEIKPRMSQIYGMMRKKEEKQRI